MAGIAKYKTVDAPVEQVYRYWRNFTNFPSFMPKVREVTPVGSDDSRTRWKVDGPMGISAEWEAEIVEDVPNEKIAWRSTEDSRVQNSGVVRFDDRGGQTSIEVAIEYSPPAGDAGDAVARVFEDPEQQVEEALDRFEDVVRRWNGGGTS